MALRRVLPDSLEGKHRLLFYFCPRTPTAGKRPDTLGDRIFWGLHLTSEVSRDLDKNRLLTFTISQANPIKLRSVTKDPTGRIHVRGRTQRRLSQKDLHAH